MCLSALLRLFGQVCIRFRAVILRPYTEASNQQHSNITLVKLLSTAVTCSPLVPFTGCCPCCKPAWRHQDVDTHTGKMTMSACLGDQEPGATCRLKARYIIVPCVPRQGRSGVPSCHVYFPTKSFDQKSLKEARMLSIGLDTGPFRTLPPSPVHGLICPRY